MSCSVLHSPIAITRGVKITLCLMPAVDIECRETSAVSLHSKSIARPHGLNRQTGSILASRHTLPSLFRTLTTAQPVASSGPPEATRKSSIYPRRVTAARPNPLPRESEKLPVITQPMILDDAEVISPSYAARQCQCMQGDEFPLNRSQTRSRTRMSTRDQSK